MLKRLLCSAVAAGLLIPQAAQAHESGDLIVRLGAAVVAPTKETSDDIVVTVPPLPNSNVSKLSGAAQPAGSITYMITDHIGIEGILALPFTVDAELSGGVPLATGSPSIGSSKYLPEVISIQYYPLKPESKFQPYVGVGLNYTMFFGGKASDALNNSAAGASTIDVDDSVGIALQAGADVMLDDKWLLNAAIWYVDLKTDLVVGTSNIGDVNINNVKVNPVIFGVTLGRKF
ncbi:OmpW family outer membrane protein [Parasphingorhabdus sp.]|uniref:OmpW/AlkL family protein n=1 Tax=Parasphingorhabdus sp. TaxID=2709688 RepID=UPI0032675A63